MDDWIKLGLGAFLIALGVWTYFMYFGKGARREMPPINGVPNRNTTVTTALPPVQALARIRTMTAAGKARLEVASERQDLVVLSDAPSLKSFANFYPCFVSAQGSGSQIVVGILPPPPQAGPAVAKRLQRMAEAVRAAVS